MKNEYASFLTFYWRYENLLKEISDQVEDFYEINVSKVEDLLAMTKKAKKDLLQMKSKKKMSSDQFFDTAKRNIAFLNRVKRLAKKGITKYKFRISAYNYYPGEALESFLANLPITTLKQCRKVQNLFETYAVEKTRDGKHCLLAYDTFNKSIMWHVDEYTPIEKQQSKDLNYHITLFSVLLQKKLKMYFFIFKILIFVCVFPYIGWCLLGIIGYIENVILRNLLYGICILLLMIFGLIFGSLLISEKEN